MACRSTTFHRSSWKLKKSQNIFIIGQHTSCLNESMMPKHTYVSGNVNIYANIRGLQMFSGYLSCTIVHPCESRMQVFLEILFSKLKHISNFLSIIIYLL